MATDATTAFDPDVEPPKGTVERALWLVHWHFEWENPDQLDKLAELYTDDIVWELPSAGIVFHGKQAAIDNYRASFDLIPELEFEQIDLYATPERVFDDRWASFVVEDVDNFPMPNLPIRSGEKVRMRLTHSFHIRDGLISRENVYQIIPPAQG